MSEARVLELEQMLGRRFPEAFRCSLVERQDKLLDGSLEFEQPASGSVDCLLTAQDILENIKNNELGIPDIGLLHIGGNLFGGYLYLRYQSEGFGEVHYLDKYQWVAQFPSFEDFIASCTLDPD